MIESLLSDFEVRDRRLARARTRRENLRMLAVTAVAIAAVALILKAGDCARHPLYEEGSGVCQSRGARPRAPGECRAILAADRKPLTLLADWPAAPEAMAAAAANAGIHPALLPCIARTEGPTRMMLDYRNPYGLESRGRLIRYVSFEQATMAAALQLARMKSRYLRGGLVDVDSLAACWCPVNRALWAANMKAIYIQANR